MMNTTENALHGSLASDLGNAHTMPPPNQPFRFLDLPREIRDEIYDYALCVFHRFDGHTIHEYSRIHAQSVFRRRQFLGTINLLLTNRQIYSEGNEYMLKKNLFVHLECYGFNVRHYLHGHAPGISVLAFDFWLEPSSIRRTGKFPLCSMHVWIGIKSKANGERKLYRKEHMDIVMLLEDLREFCKRFEIERLMASQRDPERDAVRFVVQLNPCETNRVISRYDKGLSTSESPKYVQKRLLEPIRDGLRSFPNLEIEGCAEKDLVSEVTNTVSQPQWPSFNTVNTELKKHDSDATEAWQGGELLRCAHSCAAGIGLISHLRRSSSSLRFLQESTPDIENILLQMHFTFHLLLARCLHAHLSTPTDSRVFLDENKHISSTSAALSSILDHCSDGPVVSDTLWHPTDYQRAEVAYLSSRAERFLFERTYTMDSYYSQVVLRSAQTAERYWPENKLYKEERERVEKWMEVVGRFEEWRAGRVLTATGTVMMMKWRIEYNEWDCI